MDGRNNPSWVREELLRYGLAAERKCTGTVNNPSFVAGPLAPSHLSACCENKKNLHRGIKIHNGLQKRGLVDQNQSDALVTMYAKCGELQKAQALLEMHNCSNIMPWNALIARYARERKGQKALDCFEQMQSKGIIPNEVTYACILRACGAIGAVDVGKKIHHQISREGLLEHHIVLCGALVDMYAKCGALCQARSVLEKLSSRNVVCWNALITGYAQSGQGQQALECFDQMQSEGILPNDVTYACILKACAAIRAIDKGKKIHDEILRQGQFEHHPVVSGALIDMYAKCGALLQAQRVLEKLPSRNVVCWNALIAGYAQNGQGQLALNCFEQMQREGISPDEATYSCILKACAAIGAIDKGMKVHDEILREELLEHNIVLGGALVDMYAKCGALLQARSVLERLATRDIVSWGALIAGYAQNGQGQQALECFEQMQHEGILPDEVIYACVLKACAAIGVIDKGKRVHAEIVRQGLLEHHIVLGSTLVDMYAKCGALRQAQSVLEKLSSRNVVCWNALIAGYSQHGQGQQALECFEQMQREGILPDEVTYVCVLKACAATGAIDKGKKVHDEIARQGFLEHHIVLGGALVDMYAKCGAFHQARSVLEKLVSRNVVCWNALIAGYAQNGSSQQALDCFEQMQCEGISADEVTYVCILKVCAAFGAIDRGKKVHAEIVRHGLLEHDTMVGGALVDMYAKCGALCQAQSVLEKLASCDVGPWNAMIAGYAQNGKGQQALDCFEQLQHKGILPNEVTYVCILKACAAIGAIDMGKKVHDEILRQGLLEHHIVLGGVLVDMYAKCGALHQAQSVLENLPSRNVVCWNALIAGHAQNGQGQQALDCFEQMQNEGILPDEVTFCCILNLCSHLGLVEKGQELFDNMETVYGLKPNVETVTCMTDLLGRAGHLAKAVEFIQGMPFSDNSAIWNCLLDACRKWVDVNLGTWAFQQAVELDKQDGAAYVLMVNLYAAAGMLEKAKEIEAMRVRNKAWKLPGCSSWTDPHNKVHEFCVNGTKHAESKEIELKREEMAHKILRSGYSPNLRLESQDT